MATPDYAFIDGFDHYTEKGDNTLDIVGLLTPREYTSADASVSCFITTALSGPAAGSALRFTVTIGGVFSIGNLRKTLPANYARMIGGIACKTVANPSTANAGLGIIFSDGASDQLGLIINPTTGTIRATRGAMNATVIATSAESVALGSTNFIEWDITIHATTGIIKVWINGALTTLNLTGQDTNTTANNFFNGFTITGGGINSVWTMEIDHMYLFCYTASGGVETPLLNSPIIQTDFPTSDSATAQFTIGPSVLGKDYRTTTATNAPGANQLALRQFSPETNSTLNSVSIVPAATSATAKFKAVLYADSSGSPGALVATGTEVVGCTNGSPLTLPFGSGQSLTGGTNYWIGYITDTSVAIRRFDTTTTLGQLKANTYASGAPNPAGSMTAAQPTWQIWGNMTGAASRYSQVNKGEPTVLEYNSDSVVGDKDLLNFPSLSVTPTSISLMAVRVAGLKSDGGARTINLDVKSGATTGNGTAISIGPAISLSYLTSNFWLDPNTSAAWGAAGVNAALVGYEIAT